MLKFCYILFSGLFILVLLSRGTCVDKKEKTTGAAPDIQMVEKAADPFSEPEISPSTESFALPPSDTTGISRDENSMHANAERTLEDFSEDARLALVLPCGRCHQSTLETHKPGAVAVFDLDAGGLWHNNLTAERLNGLERRAMGNTSLSQTERDAIAQFVSLKRNTLE